MNQLNDTDHLFPFSVVCLYVPCSRIIILLLLSYFLWTLPNMSFIQALSHMNYYVKFNISYSYTVDYLRYSQSIGTIIHIYTSTKI